MADDLGIRMDPGELESRAMKWELGKGSFTGRSARQFVQSLTIN
jgi:predicted AAA+ superfamily ATPase